MIWIAAELGTPVSDSIYECLAEYGVKYGALPD